MKQLLLLLAAALFLGCSSASIRYQNDTISLQYADKIINLSGQTIHRSQQNLGQISIQQYLFKDRHNENLVYEYARLQTGYTFKYSYQYTLGHIFEAKQVQLIKDENGLGYFRITLKDGHMLNAIVKTDTKRSLKILYGFSEENFKALISERVLTVQKPKETKIKEEVKSRWSVKLLIFGILLKQEGGKVLPKR